MLPTAILQMRGEILRQWPSPKPKESITTAEIRIAPTSRNARSERGGAGVSGVSMRSRDQSGSASFCSREFLERNLLGALLDNPLLLTGGHSPPPECFVLSDHQATFGALLCAAVYSGPSTCREEARHLLAICSDRSYLKSLTTKDSAPLVW